jgi:hypothetical protein
VLTWLDSSKATEIAAKFLEQHHSDIIIKKVVLDGEIWTVNVSLGMINKHNKQVKIDARRGTILECCSMWC